MSNYGKLLAQHLANELGSSVEEVTNALDSFKISEPVENTKKTTSESKKKTDVKPESKKETKKGASSDSHTCCRIKRGQKEPCGKAAKKSIQDGDKEFFYCGGEKTGCYTMALKEAAKKDMSEESVKKTSKSTKAASKGTTASKPKLTNTKEKKIESTTKTQSLLNKVVPKKSMTVKKIQTKSHGELYFEPDTRFLVDSLTKEVYGHLGDNNDTIEKLTDAQVRQIEASGHIVKDYHPPKSSKVAEPEATVESENSSDSSLSSDDDSLSESDKDDTTVVDDTDSSLSSDDDEDIDDISSLSSDSESS